MVGRLPFLRRRGALLASLLPAPAILGDAMPAVAQEPPPVNIVVVGDSLGEGVWASLYWRFYSTREVRVVNGAKASTGFNRTPYEELLDLPDGQKPQLAVVMGARRAERLALEEGGTPSVFVTPAWATLYRMERFFDAAEERGVTLIWIGMPIMRDPGFETACRWCAKHNAGLRGARRDLSRSRAGQRRRRQRLAKPRPTTVDASAPSAPTTACIFPSTARTGLPRSCSSPCSR